MPTLIAQTGPLAGSRYELGDEVVLGREDATINLADEETSRRHAAIRIVAGKPVIEDLGSTNGTFVDDRRIDTATELRGGETIQLGQTVFHIEVEPAADPGATRLGHRAPPADPGRTTMRARPDVPAPDADRTTLRARPAPPAAPEPPAPARAPVPAAPARAARAGGDQAPKPFSPPGGAGRVRRGGVATRKLAPSLMSFATIIATAVALIGYFVGR